ncbi:BadF/BadG/BcrA/BcrD ATPase family protein [Alteromonas oceanisediminis]|uniref:BadF/BadG/BcrA/BcrD ATPase family protein n=1 Tax=Alteromonas oceanisediminis TaxID=2836180 RepID=UPI001BDB209C|nr:BadF/BadG/BcrA/BcrD ATPase family protein [Alteromonas oceanisediminis]MBT0585132.1 hypothetical protein [Alteromonas oceanisediminis]
MQEQKALLVGIDGGGTHCRASLFSIDGQTIAKAKAGSANISRDLLTAKHSIVESVRQVLEKAGAKNRDAIGHTHVAAGLAGYNVTASQLDLERWKHPFASLSVTTDLHAAAHGAHASNDGAVLIAGTGSCAAALKSHQLTQIGGHGFLLGDKGSGAWLGHEAIKLSLLRYDQLLDDRFEPLRASVFDYLQVSTAIELVNTMISAAPSDFAKLAPSLFTLADNGDTVARELLQQGSDYLCSIARRALVLSEGSLCLVGGLTQSLLPYFSADIVSRVTQPKYGAEWGAILCTQMINSQLD